MKAINFDCDYMTDDEAKEIISWRYDGEYAVYNYPSWDECTRLGYTITDSNKRNDTYRSVYLSGDLFGFYNIMDRDYCVELGVGIKPELCGLGYGKAFMENAIKVTNSLYPEKKIRLLVRPFNKRAVKCYESCGFKILSSYYEDKFLTPGEMLIMEN